MNNKCIDCEMPCPEGDFYCSECLGEIMFDDDAIDWDDFWDQTDIVDDGVNDVDGP